ncbi:MAG TPA: hypothetical protein VMD97_13930 [Candidatus Aquilonibacter sp.]|nr:hypothetical protein [Candidatus Aquilonibacter sp.]
MPFQRPSNRIKATLSSLVLMLLVAGCADDGVVYDTPQNPVSGNWQVSATGSVALPRISGSLTDGTTNTGSTPVTGIFHADATTGCATVTDPISMSGSTDSNDVTTLTGSVAGGTLTITGTLSADGRSLSNATMNVSGGQCAFVAAAQATVQNYSSVTGTYAGSFSDATGPVMNVTATLSQSPDGDTDGNFTLSGTGSFGTNPCFISPVTVVNSAVSGGNFILTYTDNTKGNSVTATGTFSPDGTTLTVTNWSLTGPCGADQGTGTLTKQSGS